MRILLASTLVMASVVGSAAEETPANVGGGRFTEERMAQQQKQAQAQQSQASVQDQILTVYANLNINLAHQLDAANAQISDLKEQLVRAKTSAAPNTLGK